MTNIEAVGHMLVDTTRISDVLQHYVAQLQSSFPESQLQDLNITCLNNKSQY